MNIEDFRFLIQKERPDTLMNHFKTLCFRESFCGIFNETKILIWSSSFSVGIGYPVFELSIDSDHQLQLRKRLNKIGKIVGGVFLVLFYSVLIYALKNNYDNYSNDLLRASFFYFNSRNWPNSFKYSNL